MAGRRRWLAGILLTAPAVVCAQSPITIEQLLVREARWQLTTGLRLQTAAAPAGISRSESGWSTGLRYGLNSRFEINTRFDRSELVQRAPGASAREQSSSVSAGINWLLLRESRLPALLLQARSELWAATAGQARSFPAVQLGFTAYKSVDPIVLSLSASLLHERSYTRDSAGGGESELRLDPGPVWHLEPAINFAVNPQITLLGAMGFSQRAPLRVNGVASAVRERQLSLRLGLGYAPARRHSLFLDADMSSDAGGGLNLRWFWEF